jgi:hypothetical protein
MKLEKNKNNQQKRTTETRRYTNKNTTSTNYKKHLLCLVYGREEGNGETEINLTYVNSHKIQSGGRFPS